MLHILKSLDDVRFSQIMDVYQESILQNGRKEYSRLPEGLRVMNAEQDYYGYLREFYRIDGAFCGVWCVDGCYKSALRIEPYKDGYLLTGLETAPGERGKGYAKSLLIATLEDFRKCSTLSVYSHIEKANLPSLAVHKACGFVCIREDADYIDGTHHAESSTWIWK